MVVREYLLRGTVPGLPSVDCTFGPLTSDVSSCWGASVSRLVHFLLLTQTPFVPVLAVRNRRSFGKGGVESDLIPGSIRLTTGGFLQVKN